MGTSKREKGMVKERVGGVLGVSELAHGVTVFMSL